VTLLTSLRLLASLNLLASLVLLTSLLLLLSVMSLLLLSILLLPMCLLPLISREFNFILAVTAVPFVNGVSAIASVPVFADVLSLY
jgi:hypothetical protein